MLVAKPFLGALAGLILLTAQTPQADFAWWVTTIFVPRHHMVASIPVTQIDRSWAVASPLTEALLPPEAFQPGETVAEHGGVFELSGDLDSDGHVERALVGVYRDRSGKVGNFLLVLRQAKDGRWRKNALFKNPGKAGFNALFWDDGALVWAFCMECDIQCTVIPSRSRWKLKCEDEDP